MTYEEATDRVLLNVST